MRFTSFLARLVSLKFMLVCSFIILMTISGFLGYILTSIQSQKSMNEIAENSAHDQIDDVETLIKNKLYIAHHLNLMESIHAQSASVTLDDWVNIWYFYRPFAISLLRAFPGLVFYSGMFWRDNKTEGFDNLHMFAFNVIQNVMVFAEFNDSICNDTVHFPGSNCNVTGVEAYLADPITSEPLFSLPLVPSNDWKASSMSAWQTGILKRIKDGWKSTAADPFGLGYSDISAVQNVLTVNPDLYIECNAAILDANGNVVGQHGKDILLTFLGEFLSEMTNSSRLLVTDGRAFTFEVSNRLLTGASHGSVFLAHNTSLEGQERITPADSKDPIISKAGKELLPVLERRLKSDGSIGRIQVFFSANGKSFTCIAEELKDEYGLTWIGAIALSLTDLFYEINKAAMRMLGITAAAIIVLSIGAGLAISFMVTLPLSRLSTQMEAVAFMHLEGLDMKPSRFYEIGRMQRFFHKMVANLKEFRTFLPDAILDNSLSSGEFQTPLPTNFSTKRPSLKMKTVTTIARVSGNPLLAVGPIDEALSEGDNCSEKGGDRPTSTLPGRTTSIANVVTPFSGPGGFGGGGGGGHAFRASSVVSTATSLNRQLQPGRPAAAAPTADPPKELHGDSDFDRHASVPLRHSPWTRMSGHLSRVPIKGVGIMTHRTVSMLIADIKSFHSHCDQEALLSSLHTMVIQKVLEVAERNSGSPSPIMGDKIFVYWNVKSMNSEHAVLCVTSAMEMFRFIQFPTGAIKLPTDPSGLHGRPVQSFCPVRLACTMGPAVFGTLGTMTSRAFTVVSSSVSRCVLLQKLTKLIPVGVVCDGPMDERIRFNFHTRLVAITSPTCTIEDRVYEVLAPRVSQGDDEWMYQLKNQEADDDANKETDFVTALRALYSGADPGKVKNQMLDVLGHCNSASSPSSLWCSFSSKHPPRPTVDADNTAQPSVAQEPTPNLELIQWYIDHVDEIHGLVHPTLGFTFPTQIPYFRRCSSSDKVTKLPSSAISDADV